MNRRAFLSAFTAAAVGLATGMGLRRSEPDILEGFGGSFIQDEPHARIDSDIFRRYQEIDDRKQFELYRALAQRTEELVWQA